MNSPFFRKELCVATDRGGHLHNALMLLEQMGQLPGSVVTTYGPDIGPLKENKITQHARIISLPHLFTWIGKRRILNPIKTAAQFFLSFFRALFLRPKVVISLGATNVVFFCYWAKLFGAQIYHVECMNQVHSKSITGKLLYPICDKLFVQWEDLLGEYGPKAQYAGWVL